MHYYNPNLYTLHLAEKMVAKGATHLEMSLVNDKNVEEAMMFQRSPSEEASYLLRK